MKNVVKSSKYFFGYFNTLETHSVVQLCNIWLQEAKNRFFCPVWSACFVCYIFRYFATLENELRSGGRNTRILCRHANISLPIYNQYVAFLDNGLQTLKTLKKKYTMGRT